MHVNLLSTNVLFLYSAYHIQYGITMRSKALLPQLQPPCSLSALRAFKGINSCWVPIYYTWVKRDNCGQNALSKGIRTEWDSNPRPSDCKSRARTTYTTVLPHNRQSIANFLKRLVPYYNGTSIWQEPEFGLSKLYGKSPWKFIIWTYDLLSHRMLLAYYIQQ